MAKSDLRILNNQIISNINFEKIRPLSLKKLNKLSIKDYFGNREAYKNILKEQKQTGKKNPSGRDPKAALQQQRIRNEAFENKFNEYVDNGIEPKEAEKKLING